jgi:Na+/H+ antiporter NhaA
MTRQTLSISFILALDINEPVSAMGGIVVPALVILALVVTAHHDDAGLGWLLWKAGAWPEW